MGGVRRRPEVTEEEEQEEDAGVDARDADAGMEEACRARHVSRARPGLEGLGATTVDWDSQETEEEMEPRARSPPLWLDTGGERRQEDDDLGICDNSPTKPGALLAGKS